MAIGITGSNLSDLARNQIENDQVVGNEFANADQRGIQRQAMGQQMNQFLQELALRKQIADQQNAYQNNLLAQQANQWSTPNATALAQIAGNKDVAMIPHTQPMTPFESADLDLRKKALDNQLAMFTTPYQYGAQGVYMGNTPGGQAQAQLMIDKAQRAEKMDTAVKSANAKYLSTIPTFFQYSAYFRPGNEKVRHAQQVQSDLSQAIPEVNELQFDESANGGKGGFVNPDAPAAPANQLAAPPSPQAPPAPTPTPNQFGMVDPAATNVMFPKAVTPAPTPAPAAPQPIDGATAFKFFQQAGGDPVKARVLAAQAGYSY